MTHRIMFQTDPYYWHLLALGLKTWDARLELLGHLSDDRSALLRDQQVAQVGFWNTETHHCIWFALKGVYRAEWAPQWVFLLLGAHLKEYDFPEAVKFMPVVKRD